VINRNYFNDKAVPVDGADLEETNSSANQSDLFCDIFILLEDIDWLLELPIHQTKMIMLSDSKLFTSK
jgi:hypothetical protein